MEKLTIYQLTKYYVSRYELPTENRAGTSANANDGMQAYHRYIERLLEKTPIGEISLYDAMVPAGGGTRVISIVEFEKYCLSRFADYIRNNYAKEHNESVLTDDMKRWTLAHDMDYWEGKAQETRDNTRKALENGTYNPPMEDDEKPVVSDETVKSVGHGMMVEAIYDTLFDTFAWDMLQEDLEASQNSEDSDPMSDATGTRLKAKSRLESYWNYVGKRKNDK